MLISLLAGTFAWYSGINGALVGGILEIGTYTEVFLSKGSSETPPYNGQKGYDLNGTIFTNDDAPYYAQYDMEFKILSSYDVKLKYDINYCVIQVGALYGWTCYDTIKNIFGVDIASQPLESQNLLLQQYLGKVEQIAYDSEGANKIYQNNNGNFVAMQQGDKLNVFSPYIESDKVGYVIMTNNSQSPQENVQYIIIKSQYVSNFFHLNYSKVTKETPTEVVTPMDAQGYFYSLISDGYIATTISNIISTKTSITRFAIGYFGTKKDQNGNVISHSQFTFSDETFRGSIISFSIMAKGEEYEQK